MAAHAVVEDRQDGGAAGGVERQAERQAPPGVGVDHERKPGSPTAYRSRWRRAGCRGAYGRCTRPRTRGRRGAGRVFHRQWMVLRPGRRPGCRTGRARGRGATPWRAHGAASGRWAADARRVGCRGRPDGRTPPGPGRRGGRRRTPRPPPGGLRLKTRPERRSRDGARGSGPAPRRPSRSGVRRPCTIGCTGGHSVRWHWEAASRGF